MKLISLRVPDELLCRVEAQAKTERRSRSQMLVKLLEDLYADLRGTGVEPTGQTEQTRNRATVPVLPKAKGSAKRLHTVQSVRGKLAIRGDAPAELPQPGPASCTKGSCPHGKPNAAYCRATGGGC